MRCSFLAAVCIPEELLFSIGAVAHRSPLCPPSVSRPGLVDKKKKYNWVSSSNCFWNGYILSLVQEDIRCGPLAGGAGF